jgi:hypothetical protein
VQEGIVLLIKKIHRKKNPTAATAKALKAVDTEPENPDLPPLAPVDESWERDV